jgi:hypothetical protein
MYTTRPCDVKIQLFTIFFCQLMGVVSTPCMIGAYGNAWAVKEEQNATTKTHFHAQWWQMGGRVFIRNHDPPTRRYDWSDHVRIHHPTSCSIILQDANSKASVVTHMLNNKLASVQQNCHLVLPHQTFKSSWPRGLQAWIPLSCHINIKSIYCIEAGIF